MEIAFSPNKNKVQFMVMKGSVNNEQLQLVSSIISLFLNLCFCFFTFFTFYQVRENVP